jgi:hypothetical protein
MRPAHRRRDPPNNIVGRDPGCSLGTSPLREDRAFACRALAWSTRNPAEVRCSSEPSKLALR